MAQDECQRFGVKAYVKCIQDCAAHRHTVVSFKNLGRIRCHDGHGIATFDAASGQSAGQLPAAAGGFTPGAAEGSVNNGDFLRIDPGRAGEERKRTQRREIRGPTLKVGVVDRIHVD